MLFPFMHVSGYTCLFMCTKKLENLNANNAMYMNSKKYSWQLTGNMGYIYQ